MSFFSRLFTKKNFKRLAIVSLGGAALYPQIDSRIELYHQDTPIHRFVKEKCAEIRKQYFFPTPYLGYGILQAIFGSESQHRHEMIVHEKKYLDLGDYGEVAYDTAKLADESLICPEKKVKNQNKLIVILLGVTAASTEPYIENMTAEALKDGYTVVLFNERLYNNYESKNNVYPKEGFYDVIRDFEHIVSHVEEVYKDFKFYAIGHSFGASTLVKYLGTHIKHPFEGAVSIANPFDFIQAQNMLTPRFNRYFMETRKRVIQMREAIFENSPSHIGIDLKKVYESKTTEEFDDSFSKKVYGLASISEFYEKISCVQHLKNVNIPLLCMNSKDDPMVHHSTIPFDIAKINQHIMLLVTQCGGHVGWFEGFLSPRRWYMKPTLEFLNALSEFKK